MKKLNRKWIAGILAISVGVSLSACGENKKEGNGNKEGKQAVIGVALYSDSGPQGDGIQAYLASIADELNTEFKYTVLTQTDEAANLTKIQELISSGVDGIICTMDLGTQSILDECAAANVYLAGYLCDYNVSYSDDYDKVFKNDYFLGTVADGACCKEEVTKGKEFFNGIVEYNERNQENQIKHVSIARNPDWAFPLCVAETEQFVQELEEYNKTAETPIELDPFNEDSDVLQFAPLDSTYFSKHPDIDAIMNFGSSYFVYSTMVSAGKDKDVKLFANGYDPGSEAYFGTAGAGTLQLTAVTPIESINYPLVMLLNAINGVSYPDQPKEAQRLSSSQFILNSDEDMEAFRKNVYFTGKGEDAMFTGEDVLNMTAYGNEKATYTELVESLKHLNIDNIK